jgi:hypothetical protein
MPMRIRIRLKCPRSAEMKISYQSTSTYFSYNKNISKKTDRKVFKMMFLLKFRPFYLGHRMTDLVEASPFKRQLNVPQYSGRKEHSLHRAIICICFFSRRGFPDDFGQSRYDILLRKGVDNCFYYLGTSLEYLTFGELGVFESMSDDKCHFVLCSSQEP